jgi:hypothetical protein
MLEPVAFEKSLDSYLDSQSPEEIRALVLRSIKRLDGAHRVQLALFLGLDVAGDPITEVGGSSIDDRELREFIESCALLRERFGAFLRDNPRAIRALGKNVSERILGPTESVHAAFLRRVPPKLAAAIALALVVMFVPLAAQYEHQRGMNAGPSELSVEPPAAAQPPARFASTVTPVRGTMRAHAAIAPVTRERHVAIHAAVPRRARHTYRPSLRIAAQPRARSYRVYVASGWKFDPRFNPYFNKSAWHIVHFVPQRTARVRPYGPAPLPAGFEGRATLIVTSYLNAMIAGNTPSALHHLGLPATAPRTNLSESPIISRDSHARVVSVDAQPDGRAKVEVDITGRTGEYFEIFYVAHDGPAVRIMDRYYIPVNRTAEERAARLLAKDGH